MHDRITSSYEHALAHAYHKIDGRGLLLDRDRLKNTRISVSDTIKDYCNKMSQMWGTHVYIGAENKDRSKPNSFNINASRQLIDALTSYGYKVPKVRIKNQSTEDYEWKESANDLAMQRLYADPTSWPSPAHGEGIKWLMSAKELITFRTRYLNAKLIFDTYYSSYSVTGTTTGRRSSKKNAFSLGGNSQNFPARMGALSDQWKETIIARPGRVFLFVDQMQAEDWPVQSLASNYAALEEMRKGVNRHYKFASAIFGTPIDDLKVGRANGDHKSELEYNLGKRGRHANNYGMQPPRMSEILAGEGYSVPILMCQHILNKINEVDPNVKGVFHEYIKNCLSASRMLITPLGRERQFFGLRDNDRNYAIFNEAYAYIPQSVVGDNTGMAVLYLDGCNDYVVQEGHDSIVQEVPDQITELTKVFLDTQAAFKRTIRFHNGIEIEIPIEAAIGYDWKNKVKVNDKGWEYTPEKLEQAYKLLQERYPRNATAVKQAMA